MNETLKCFKPLVNKKSRVLILGSMPGPEALRKQQYYGFEGNHFWHIVPHLLGEPRPKEYEKRVDLLVRHNVALWDVLASCIRPGALDSAIKNPAPNDIPTLLRKFPNIRAIFINGRLAHKIFMKHHEGKIDRPIFYLPSTSPANAAMSINAKIKQWGRILEYLSD